MRYRLSFLFASEIRFCTLLIGLIELIWAWIGVLPAPSQSLFASRLYAAGLGLEWFGVMLGVGVLTTAGSLLPWRSGRHIGLALSSLLWITMSIVFFELIDDSPVAASMPLFAAFSLGLIYADSKRKCREKPLAG